MIYARGVDYNKEKIPTVCNAFVFWKSPEMTTNTTGENNGFMTITIITYEFGI